MCAHICIMFNTDHYQNDMYTGHLPLTVNAQNSMYRRVPRYIPPPPPPPPKKNGPYLNECIFVLVNASAYLFQHFGKELVLQQDFKE